MFNYLKSLPVQLIISILLAFGLGRIMDSSSVAWFYTASSGFIEILLFILPVMIFSFIYSAITKFKQKSVYLILLIFLGVFLSNSLALYTAYFFSSFTMPFIGITYTPEFFTNFNSQIEPLFKLNLPSILSSDRAMFFAAALGIFMSSMHEKNKLRVKVNSVVSKLGQYVSGFLHKIFIPLLPLYVFGFCLKLSYDQALIYLFESYGKVFLLICF